jgi:hypothetical protein
MNPITKSFDCSADIAAKRIVKFSADYTVAQASAATDDMVGVSDLGGDSGGRCDVTLFGEAIVVAGGAIARGKPFTADANGKAVLCDPAAGTVAQAMGITLQAAAADGDEIRVLVSRSQVTKPAA